MKKLIICLLLSLSIAQSHAEISRYQKQAIIGGAIALVGAVTLTGAAAADISYAITNKKLKKYIQLLSLTKTGNITKLNKKELSKKDRKKLQKLHMELIKVFPKLASIDPRAARTYLKMKQWICRAFELLGGATILCGGVHGVLQLRADHLVKKFTGEGSENVPVSDGIPTNNPFLLKVVDWLVYYFVTGTVGNPFKKNDQIN